MYSVLFVTLQVDDNSSYTIMSMEDIRVETPQESREADEKPNSMEDTLKEAMERMRRKHALRTAGLLEHNDASAPPEDETVGTIFLVIYFFQFVFLIINDTARYL